MYMLMAALNKSGIPIEFKGSMVLKACLLEAGFSDETRHTVDIDANWRTDTPPTAEQMTGSIQKAISDSHLNLHVELYRMYGERKSAGFKIFDTNTGECLFKMDMDVNRPPIPIKLYQIGDIRFCGVTPIQMTADKVSVISNNKIFRRIKDVVDLYYLSKVFVFRKDEVLSALSHSGKTLGDFDAFLHRKTELEHAYKKFRFYGNAHRPSFETVYKSTKDFIRPILPIERDLKRENDEWER